MQSSSRIVNISSDLRSADPTAEIRMELEREYQQKCIQLQHLYEMRVEGLREGIKEAFRLVRNDELIDTMQQDETSEEFVNQRVKELIEECINGNREALIEKLSQEVAELHGEFAKLENENTKLMTQREAIIDEANSKIIQAEEGREVYGEEVENLQKNIQGLERKYEEALKKKDEQMIQRSERDLAEIQMMRDKVKDLETKLRESENKSWEITQDQTLLEKEFENLKGKYRQQEIDIGTLNMELAGVSTREESARRRITEQEDTQKEMKINLEILKRECEKLKGDLEISETNKRSIESQFKTRIEEIQGTVQKESERQKEQIEKMQGKYHEKMEKYKKKILECKNKINEKEKEIRDVSRKSAEDHIVQEKNIEIMQLRLQEQKESYENKMMQIEEENHQKLNELQLRYDDQLRDLQTQFQRVLDQKINQIQEDAQEQISQIRDQERELQEILEEKIIQVERDYIKVSQHDEILQEKDKLIERLKQEINNKELDHRQETSAKMRNLENRLRDEIEEKEKIIKGMVRDFEGKVNAMEGDRRKIREEIEDKHEENQRLRQSITELESQKKKLMEALEDWGSKTKKLREAYEEEQRRRIELERNVKEQHENFGEIRSLLDETRDEIGNRDNHIEYLEHELANLENSMVGQTKQYHGLEREYEDMKKEFTRRDQSKDKLIAELKEEVQRVKDEGYKLNNMIGDTEKRGEERYRLEAKEHDETKNRMKQEEGRVRNLVSELKESESREKKLNSYIGDLEKDNSKLKAKLQDLENAFTEIEREKIGLEQRLDRMKSTNDQFRRDLEVALTVKLRSLRSELREVEADCLNITNTVKKETETKVEGLLSKFKKILERKNEQVKNEKEILRERLDREFTYEIQNLKEEYERTLKEHGGKIGDKDRMIIALSEENESVKEKIEMLEEELQREKSKRLELEDEIEHTVTEINERKKEKEVSERKTEEIKARLMEEVSNIQRELRRVKEEFSEEKRTMEDRYEKEIEYLNSQTDLAQEKFRQTLIGFEDKVKEISENQTAELTKLKKSYEDEIDKLSEELIKRQDAESMVRDQAEQLKDEIEKLNRTCFDLEREKQELMHLYESKLEGAEREIEEAATFTRREVQKMEELKLERLTETKRYRKTIQDLEDEIRERGERISSLLEERNAFLERIKELSRQLDAKDGEMEKHKQDIVGRSVQQTKEIEQLHKLLTKSYKTVNESLERSKEEPDVDINRSVEELKRLEKYLEKRSPSKGYVPSSQKERDLETSGTRNLNDSEHRSVRDKRSWPAQTKY